MYRLTRADTPWVIPRARCSGCVQWVPERMQIPCCARVTASPITSPSDLCHHNLAGTMCVLTGDRSAHSAHCVIAVYNAMSTSSARMAV
eukprot:7787788-Pyramimonas_sp.AAC.1